KLAGGVLTYSVAGSDQTALSILRGAVQAWDDALPDLTMTQVTSKADISFVYGPGAADGGESPNGTGARGLTTTYLNGRRLVLRVEIGIDGGPAPVNAGAIEEIAKHEFGHALGIGHANWDGDLMSPLGNPAPGWSHWPRPAPAPPRREAPPPPCVTRTSATEARAADRWWAKAHRAIRCR